MVRIELLNIRDIYSVFVFIVAIEAQSKAMRDDRRKEEDEARGTRFGQQILDTDVYEENAKSGYLKLFTRN